MSKNSLITDSILYFFILYAFRIPVFYNSTVVATIFLLVVSLPRLKVSLLMNKSLYLQGILYLSVVFLIIIIGTLHRTYDYSKVNVLYSHVFSFISTLLFVNKISVNKNIIDKTEYVFKVISIVFILQCFFIIFAFFNNELRILISHFQANTRTEGTVREGVRALSLAGGQYFTLTVAFMVCNVSLGFYLAHYKKISVSYFLLIQVFVALTASTAGRTFFVSIPFSFLVYFYYSYNHNRPNVKSFFGNLAILIAISILSIYLLPLLKFEKIEQYINFAFEFAINYLSYGSVETESTSILANMYFDLDFTTFLLGDGQYTNIDGSYYLNTDAGFMRNILYYGVLGLFINYLIFSFKLFVISTNKKKLLSLVFFVMLSIAHVKGEAITHITGVEVLLWSLFFTGLIERFRLENSNHLRL